MYWHIETDIISLLFMLVLYASIRRDYHRGNRQERSLLLCVLNCIFVLVVDVLASIAMETAIPVWLYEAAMTLYYASVMMVINAWAFYSAEIVFERSPQSRKRGQVIIMGAYFLYLAIVLIYLKTGWIYVIDEAGVYSRGPYLPVLIAYYILDAVIIVGVILYHFNRIRQDIHRLLLILLPVLLGVGAVIQLKLPGCLTMYPAYALSLFISYLFIQRGNTERLIWQKDGEIRRVSQMATTDTMTGLLNHSETFRRIEEYLAKKPEGTHALFMIDMDDFKKINDTLGHLAGDEIVRQTARRIKSYLGAQDIAGRIGGDEFLVLMKHVLPDELDRRAAGLLEVLQFDCIQTVPEVCEASKAGNPTAVDPTAVGATAVNPTAVGATAVNPTAVGATAVNPTAVGATEFNPTAVGATVSIGIGLTGEGADINRLFSDADAALYKAKSLGKNRYCIAGGDAQTSRAGEALRAVNLFSLLENMSSGILLASLLPSGEIQIDYISGSYYKYIAVDPRLRERPLHEAFNSVYEADRPILVDALHQVAKTGGVIDRLYRCGPEGDRRHLCSAVRLPPVSDNRTSVIAVVTDVTNLKEIDTLIVQPPKTAQEGKAAPGHAVNRKSR